ncbi:MAG TPA: M28 family peptidase [Allosphingosinicella sp.]|jgi:Zn-dependent M28 family amino/carboxypeptidase|nr:M28 family peptidase [Allosphingosinicella sp.]
MFKGLILTLFLFATPLAAPRAPAPIAPADLLRHIAILASDRFEGRAPGTAGERRTTDYIVAQFRARGLEAAGENGTWLQTLHLVQRRPGSATVRWTAGGRPVEIAPDKIVLTGREPRTLVADAAIVFAGHGARLIERGIDQLAGTDVRGKVVLILMQGPEIAGFPSAGERMLAVSEAGAAAVIGIVGDDLPWETVAAAFREGSTGDAATPTPALYGLMPMAAAQRLVNAAGGDMGRLLNDQPGSSFRAVALNARARMDVTTQVTPLDTSNVIGRLRGSRATGESLLLLAHWDHLGSQCRPAGEADRICNGAVDNASGVASLIEIAGRLAFLPRQPRDMLFMATAAEEMGLLGASYFAEHPIVPLASIVAAINMDTVAIHPAGEPVAMMGRGTPALDRLVDATIVDMGRRIDPDDEAAAFVQRQDGWALARHGVPAIMVGGSFSNLALLNAFLGGRYHGPDDEADGQLMLDGAAEDANLIVTLAGRLADPATYQRQQRPAS